MGRALRIAAWIAFGLIGLLGVAFGAALFLDTVERPAPDIVPGYLTREIEVAHRDVPLPVHLWYPAQEGSPVAPVLLGQNALFYGAHVRPAAAPRRDPAPIVVLSHGSGGRALTMNWLATGLARNGMIVVATDHPGTRSQDSDPHRTPHVWQRTGDVTALLDWLSKEPPDGLAPDTSRVAALGFSLGGHTALASGGLRVSKQMFIDYCDRNAGLLDCGWMQRAGVDFDRVDRARYEASLKDDRVGAVVAVDPALVQAVPAGGLDDLTRPVLIVNLGAQQDVPAAMRADELARRAGVGVSYKTIDGAWHFSFLSECSTLGRIVIGLAGDDNICADASARDRGDIHDALLKQISGFLSTALDVRAQTDDD